MKTAGEERVLLRKDKVDLMKKVLRNQNEVVKTAFVIDVVMNCDLSTSFKLLIPKTNNLIAKASNKNLSEMIINLFEPFELVHNYLVEEQFGKGREKLTRRKKKRKPVGTVYLLSEGFLNLRDRIDRKVILQIQSDENPLSKWMVKLSDAQRQRTFSIERIPADPNHRRCLVCGNLTINEPEENEQVVKHNEEVDRNYAMKSVAWNEYLKDNDKNEGKNCKKAAFPTDPTNPSKTLKRQPTKAAYKSQVLQCMASTSKCVMRNSDTCSTCPIWCINDKTGLRYPFTSKCECPVCTSTCTAAYHVHNFHVLSINMAMLTNQKEAGLLETTNDKQNKLGGFLGSMFSSGMQTALAMQQTKTTGENKKMRRNINSTLMDTKPAAKKEYKPEDIENAFFESVALNICKQGPSAMSVNDRNEIGGILGTDTQVQLPKGATLDTVSLGRNANQHGMNNRLAVGGSDEQVVTPIQPGMVSKYHIDYSPPRTKEFEAAAKGIQSDEALVGKAIDFGTAVDENEVKYVPHHAVTPDVNAHKVVHGSMTEKAWERMKLRNKSNLLLKKKGKLTDEETQQRNRARRIGIHMMKNEGMRDKILDLITLESEIESGDFHAQDLVDRYESVYMGCDDK